MQYFEGHPYRQYSCDNCTKKSPPRYVAATCKFTFQKILSKRDIVSFTTCGCTISWETAPCSSLRKSATNCWIILWYTSAVIVVSKKNGSTKRLRLMVHQMPIFVNLMTLFGKCEGSISSKHDNFACLCGHVNGTRLHRYKEHIERWNITACKATKPSTKLGSFRWTSWL